MLALIGYYWAWLLVAFLIGLGTAWWVWGLDPHRERIARASDDEPIVWPESEKLLGVPPAPELAYEPVLELEPERANETAAELPAEASALPVTEPIAAVVHLADEPVATPPVEDEQRGSPIVYFVTPPAPPATPDDLTVINGIGPQLNTLLGSLGITRYDQIARWGPQDVDRIDSHLGVFRGRIVRDDWIEQAKLLIAGDFETFQARYGEQ